MAIYVDSEKAADLLRSHVCGVCGGRLTDPWDPVENCYRIECGTDKAHMGIQRVASLTESYRRGEPIDPTIEAGVKRGIAKRTRTQTPAAIPGGIVLPHATDAGNEQPLTIEQIQGLIAYAERIGLDALLGHVCLYFGRPWVHIDGWYFHARRCGWRGGARSAPLSKEERLTMNLSEDVEAWKCEIYDHEGGFLAVGYGLASRDPEVRFIKGVPEKWGTPQRRAEKRAEEDAFRKAFPLQGIPDEEEVTGG